VIGSGFAEKAIAARECTPTGKLFAVQFKGTLHRRRPPGIRSDAQQHHAEKGRGRKPVCALSRDCRQRVRIGMMRRAQLIARCRVRRSIHGTRRRCGRRAAPQPRVRARLMIGRTPLFSLRSFSTQRGRRRPISLSRRHSGGMNRRESGAAFRELSGTAGVPRGVSSVRKSWARKPV
jgi:hypothetical protein